MLLNKREDFGLLQHCYTSQSSLWQADLVKANSRISLPSRAMDLAIWIRLPLLSLPTSPLSPQLNSTARIMSGVIYSCYTDKALPNPSLSPWPLYAQTANARGDFCLIASESCSVRMVQAPAWESRDTGRRSLRFFSGYARKYERSHCFPEPSKPPNPCKHQLVHKDSPDKAGQHPARA